MDSLAEMLLAARADRDKAEEAREKLEIRFMHSRQGLAMLKSTRLTQELEKANDTIRQLQDRLAEQVCRFVLYVVRIP